MTEKVFFVVCLFLKFAGLGSSKMFFSEFYTVAADRFPVETVQKKMFTDARKEIHAQKFCMSSFHWAIGETQCRSHLFKSDDCRVEVKSKQTSV